MDQTETKPVLSEREFIAQLLAARERGANFGGSSKPPKQPTMLFLPLLPTKFVHPSPLAEEIGLA